MVLRRLLVRLTQAICDPPNAPLPIRKIPSASERYHSAQLIMSYGLNSLRWSCGPLTMPCQCADGQRWSWVTYQLRGDASERCLVYAESLLEMCKENGYYQVVLDCSSALFSHQLTHQYVLLRHLLVLRCMPETSLSDIINMWYTCPPPIGEPPPHTIWLSQMIHLDSTFSNDSLLRNSSYVPSQSVLWCSQLRCH